jgi:2-hydroxychromene-2-carboxylate isomerase
MEAQRESVKQAARTTLGREEPEETKMNGSLQFAFSVRSPYAWIAAHRILPRVHSDVEVRWVPLYPLPTFPNFGTLLPTKIRYIIEDLIRLTKAYDLPLGRPPAAEPDWAVPHAAFLEADRQGRGSVFARALMDARWSRGEDVSSEPVLRRAADQAGADAAPLLAASADTRLRAQLARDIQRRYDVDGIFGVPMFILPDGSRFWGHDRMEWALQHGYVPAANAS